MVDFAARALERVMLDPPIIEVRLGPHGELDYRLRTSVLDTRAYGCILASLAAQIGKMMQAEGGLNAELVRAQIAHHFIQELEQPTAQVDLHQLQ
jgi:hypothetical protein